MTDAHQRTPGEGVSDVARPYPTPEDPSGGIGPGDGSITVCGAPTRAGNPCRVRIDLCPTHGTCAAHDPCRQAAFRDRQVAATAAATAAAVGRLRRTSAQGGTSLQPWPLAHPGAPRDVDEVTVLITEAVAAVARGALRPDVGRAIAAMCETALRGYKTAELARALAEQRERLAALERGRR